GAELLVEALYDQSRFDSVTIERMFSHFEVLLESIASAPEEGVSELNILSEREWRQLTVDFNPTARDYPSGASIHELFERQAKQAPDRVAVVFGDEEVSYSE